MIKSIFYARFHPERGPKVLHQVPEGSVIPCQSSATAQTPFFDFQSVSDYIIPRREFCDRLLVVCCNHHRIVGFPVCITNDLKYDRNDFIFNFCVVLDEDEQWSAYASVVKKLARVFKNLEEQGNFLSKEEERDDLIVAGQEGYGGGAKVYALCEMIMEDLNNYCECMIPIDESNTLNLKLFPSRPPPPPVHGWHVPLSIVRFSSLQTSSWDLTVQRIIPYIDGVHPVSMIATLSDSDLALTRRAIAHLVFYGCVLLLDIFSFSAMYAPTAEISVLVTEESMQDECRRYIASSISHFGKDAAQIRALTSSLNSFPKSKSPGTIALASQASESAIPSRSEVIDLYTSLRQGLSLRDWCLSHSLQLANVDIRRFITFGIIKGFLYRVHKYALALRPKDLDLEDLDDPVANQRAHERAWRKAAMSSGWVTPKEEKKEGVDDGKGGEYWEKKAAETGETMGLETLDLPLARYLDGNHSLDEVTTELKMVERDVVRKFKEFGDVVFMQR